LIHELTSCKVHFPMLEYARAGYNTLVDLQNGPTKSFGPQ